MNEVIDGAVRDLGKPYANGTPRLEIHVPIGRTGTLPVQVNERVFVRLLIAGIEYSAGLRSTPDNKYAQFCPDVLGPGGEETNLGSVLTAAGFRANDSVQLLVTGALVDVRRG